MIARNTLLLCSAAVLSLAMTGASAAGPASKPEASVAQVPSGAERQRNQRLETYLRGEMQRRGIPGMQVAVVRHGKIVFLGAYGVANIEYAQPVTWQTVFPINSATKAFTGVAAMQLVEDGKLDLSAPVSRYLVDLPVAWRAVTIKQLLTHTSGIPDMIDPASGRLLVEDDEAATMARIKALPMSFSIGERFSYNQTNYLLLGRVIERLSGQPFARVVSERQFRAVGMPLTDRSGFSDAYDIVQGAAPTYNFYRKVDGVTRKTDTLIHSLFSSPPSMWPGVGIDTTAEEAAHWIIALQQGRLFKKKETLATLWTPGTLNDGSPRAWAIGWASINRPEHRAVGGIGGARSAFYVYPEDDLAVIVLTNLQGAQPQSFIDEVAGHYLPDLLAANGGGLPPAIKTLRLALMKRGFEHAPAVFKEAKEDPAFNVSESELNNWGYVLIGQEKRSDAVHVFKLNAQLYPNSANAFDSLGEAYEASGEKTLAIDSYKRALALDPGNRNAATRLSELGKVGQ